MTIRKLEKVRKSEQTIVPVKRMYAGMLLFLKKVTDFAVAITNERSTPDASKCIDSLTRTEREFHNFDNFSFRVKRNWSLGGQNSVEVFYHPGKPYGKDALLVLKTLWRTDIGQYDVPIFDPGKGWQKDIRRVMLTRAKISAELDRAEAASGEEGRARQEERARRLQLQKQTRTIHKFVE